MSSKLLITSAKLKLKLNILKSQTLVSKKQAKIGLLTALVSLPVTAIAVVAKKFKR